MTAPTQFAVMGSAFGNGRPMLIRRHPTHESAAQDALRLDMKKWDDVWVEACERKPEKIIPTAPPPLPWNVQWLEGRAYIIDAGGKKIASLLGCQTQREFVAGVICDLCREQAA